MPVAQQPAHYDTYREELGKAYPGFGHALWEPDPGDQSPVEVGDVGFIREGHFHRLFNALLPANHASHERFGVPEGHEPLRLTLTNHTSRRVLTPNTFHSRGVTVRSGGLEVLAGTTIGSAEVSFSCTKEHGAVMSLPVTARCEDTLTLGHFRKWIIRNIDTWFAFTEMHGLGLDMEDIALVTGCHRTRSWSNVAFTEVHTDAQFSLGVEVTGALGASINWRASNHRIQGAVLSQGPSGENLPENQCIFIRGFRVKRIFRIFPRLKGAAEPRPDPRWDDREQEIQVVPIPSVSTRYQDPLHVLLDYIASRATDCHLALVHDSDLEQILGASDGTPLESLRPDVVMEHLRRSKLEIGVMSDAFSTDDEYAGKDMAQTRVAMLSEQLHSFGPFDLQTSVLSLSDFSTGTTNTEQTNQYVPSEQLPGELFPTPARPDLTSQIDSINPPATSTPSRKILWHCPACSAVFSRPKEGKRHLLTHLPHSIHCPVPHCSWTGNRLKRFHQHWQRRHVSYGLIPGRKEVEVYDPQVFVQQINAGTMTVDVAVVMALGQLEVRAKTDQLRKATSLVNVLDNKLWAGDKDPSETLVTPTTDENEDPPPWASAISEKLPPGLRRRKKVKGYCTNSEGDRSGEPDFPFSRSEAEGTQGCDTWEPPIPYNKSSNTYLDSLEIRATTNAPSMISTILPSLLPSGCVVSDNISVSYGISFASSTFDTLTYHRELRDAQLDSDFERVIVKLAHEWYYVGASLLFIAAVDTSVFGFSSSDLFAIDNFAKRALIISSIAAAIGLFVDVWFIFAYSGSDVRKFQSLALDLYGSYFFFALSSRLPLVALSVSVLALVAFLGAIAWATWPAAVLVMCVLAGILVSLRFIVFGCHRIALGFACILRGAWLGALYVFRRMRVFGRGADAQGEVQVGGPSAQVVVRPPGRSRNTV